MSTSTQRIRRREQRETTRRQILEVADRFLRQRPYRELSVELVMADTGLTRTAFYRHFDDVTQLVIRLLEDVGTELYIVAERWLEGAAEDFPAAARAGLTGIVSFFERNGPLVRAVAEAAVTDEQIESGYRGFLDTFIEMTVRGLDDAMASSQIDRLDSRQVARALTLMNESYLLDEFGRTPHGDPAAALATLERIWLSAVGATGSAPRG